MKQLCFLIIALFCFIPGKSQRPGGSNQSDANQLTKVPIPQLKVDESFINSKAKWKLISTNKDAKVYESPVDKMHCIAFNFPSNMPLTGTPLNTQNLRNEKFSTPNVMLNDMRIPTPLNLPGGEISK